MGIIKIKITSNPEKMRSLVIIAIACVLVQTVVGAGLGASTTQNCTATTNPFTTTRCINNNCHPYVADTAATTETTKGGFACTTAATGYHTYPETSYGSTTDGTTNDYVCSTTCGDTATNLDSVAPCDSTGLLCTVCATGYNTSGKAPTATSQQPCNCKIDATNASVTACSSCAHGYYGVDSNSTAVVPSDVGGSGDGSYLNYATTAAAKCIACPTTLTNCAQCASSTTCAVCTTASGNTVDSSGSCSAAKIFASIALVFVGMIALIF